VHPVTRRRFLEASLGAAAAAWRADPDRVLGTLPFLGEGSFPLERTIGEGLGRRRALDLSTLRPGSLITPSERFFVRTGCPEPLPPTESWSVRLRGLVETPLEIPVETLGREAVDMGAQLLECAGNSRAARFGLMSAARFSGVKLERVLDRARLRPGAKRVLVSGFDEHSVLDPGSVSGASWIFGLDEVREAGAFLATGMNGAPLGPDHGHPLRLVVPGWYACTAIKWVNEILLVDDDVPATEHMREYAGRTHQDPAGPTLAREFQPARIDPAALPVRVEKRETREGRISYRIVGVLWGGPIPAGALAIRLDGRQPSTPVQRVEADVPGAWTLWSHDTGVLAPGRHRVELAVLDPATRSRRLEAGFYAREIAVLS
jgi:DMSO/TMAO reductase YedYZ molybdopterin-dependent catalytic subunit